MWYKIIFIFNWEGIAMHPRSQFMSSGFVLGNKFGSTCWGLLHIVS